MVVRSIALVPKILLCLYQIRFIDIVSVLGRWRYFPEKDKPPEQQAFVKDMSPPIFRYKAVPTLYFVCFIWFVIIKSFIGWSFFQKYLQHNSTIGMSSVARLVADLHHSTKPQEMYENCAQLSLFFFSFILNSTKRMEIVLIHKRTFKVCSGKSYQRIIALCRFGIWWSRVQQC